jgi:branched-chain amino acid transport system ATP-binding protein
MLEIVDLRVSYGKVETVHGISLTVPARAIVSFVGSNGAGKTTTLRSISGLVKPRAGKILFKGKDISQFKAHDTARLGISHVPEGRRVFREMTVAENLRMGAYWRCANPKIEYAMERMFAYFPRLKERQKQLAGTLSGGEQQMLSIGRALISGPTLLMVDEPSFGLAPMIVDEIARIVTEINRWEGLTVLLVEQNVQMAFAVSQHTYVMENGAIVLSGESKTVAQNPRVQSAYLGNGTTG